MKKPYYWSENETKYLEKSWGKVTIKTISKIVNRTPKAVKNKAYHLGLPHRLAMDDRVPLNQIIIAFYGGVKQGSAIVKRWLDLNVPVKKIRREKSFVYVIDIDEFWKWAKKNKTLINFSRLQENILGPEPGWIKEKRRIDIVYKTKKNEEWTALDEQILVDMLNTFKYDYHEIATRLNRSESSIRKRMIKLGIKQRPLKREARKWTKKEEETVLAMRNKGYTYEHIGTLIDRSGTSVSWKYNRLTEDKK